MEWKYQLENKCKTFKFRKISFCVVLGMKNDSNASKRYYLRAMVTTPFYRMHCFIPRTYINTHQQAALHWNGNIGAAHIHRARKSTQKRTDATTWTGTFVMNKFEKMENLCAHFYVSKPTDREWISHQKCVNLMQCSRMAWPGCLRCRMLRLTILNSCEFIIWEQKCTFNVQAYEFFSFFSAHLSHGDDDQKMNAIQHRSEYTL